jgi:hypothetical protein
MGTAGSDGGYNGGCNGGYNGGYNGGSYRGPRKGIKRDLQCPCLMVTRPRPNQEAWFKSWARNRLPANRSLGFCFEIPI